MPATSGASHRRCFVRDRCDPAVLPVWCIDRVSSQSACRIALPAASGKPGYMGSLDASSYSFVVKIWKEPTDPDASNPDWRGSVENVVSGKRVYFRSLNELCQHLHGVSGMQVFIEPPAPRHYCRARRNHDRCDWY